MVRIKATAAILMLTAGCQSSTSLITDTLNRQSAAWNRGDIDGYMAGYWQSPELTFSGGGRTTRGWTATRDRYAAKYDSREKMGTLTFSDLEITMLSRDAALVLGRWHLLRQPENADGNFSLVMRRERDGHQFPEKLRWLIIHDHSSVEPPPASAPSTSQPSHS